MTVGSLLARGASLVVGVVLLSACADDGAPGAASQTATPTPRPTVTATRPAPPTPVPLPTAVQASIAQAATDAGVPAADVELIEFRGEDWSNSALGCPEPGKFYAQVVTPGYIVLVRIAGTEREYHTDLSSRVVSCDEAQE